MGGKIDRQPIFFDHPKLVIMIRDLDKSNLDIYFKSSFSPIKDIFEKYKKLSKIKIAQQRKIGLKKCKNNQLVPLDSFLFKHLDAQRNQNEPLFYVCYVNESDLSFSIQCAKQSKISNEEQEEDVKILHLVYQKNEITFCYYDKEKNLTLYDFLEKRQKNLFYTNFSFSYYLQYKGLRIDTHQRLTKLEQIEDFNQQKNVIIILKECSLKYAFFKLLQIFKKQHYPNEIKKLQKNYGKKDKHFAIQQYTSDYYKLLNERLRIRQFLSKYPENQKDMQYYAFTIKLLQELNQIRSHYIGRVYRAINDKKNYQVNSVECLSAFTSTSIEHKETKMFRGGVNYTQYQIFSLTGTLISKYSSIFKENEVLMPVFTYFLVTKVQEFECHNKIYMMEIPSPSTANIQRITLWVDDKPQNNKNIIKKLPSPRTEVYQLTSTQIFKIWIEYFFNQFKHIKTSVITNRTREGKSDEGLNLILHIIEQKYNFPCMLYCSNSEQGQKQVAHLKQKLVQQIIVSRFWQDAQKFCKL